VHSLPATNCILTYIRHSGAIRTYAGTPQTQSEAATMGDGFSEDDSTDDETNGYPERGLQPPAPSTEWARFLKDSGYYIITKNEGRYNEAVATHLTRPYFAKVECINNQHVEATTSCLNSWVNIGKIPNCVQLFDFKLTDDNTRVVLIMEKAPGIIMSKVMAGFFDKHGLRNPDDGGYDNSTPSHPATTADGRKTLVQYEILRLEACVSVYKKTKFYQMDWKSDNMFYDSMTESITLIDMPFAAFDVKNPELYNDLVHGSFGMRLNQAFNWWTDDKTAAPSFQRRSNDYEMCTAFVNSWAVRNMTTVEIRLSEYNTPQRDLDLFMKLVPDFLNLRWPEFKEKTEDDIIATYINSVRRARVAHGTAVQSAQKMRDITIQDAMLAATKTYDTAIELAGITHRQAKQTARADRTRELQKQDEMAEKLAAVFGVMRKYSIEAANAELNYGRPKSYRTQRPFTDYQIK